jgi:hypothetical protein
MVLTVNTKLIGFFFLVEHKSRPRCIMYALGSVYCDMPIITAYNTTLVKPSELWGVRNYSRAK